VTVPTTNSPESDATEADQASAQLAQELRPGLLRLSRVMRNQGDATLTVTLTSALATVWTRGPLSAGELAAVERVQPPSMTKIISGLEERGLVRRQPHPHDKRQAIIEITDSGRELLDAERRSRDAWLTKRLATLTDEQRELLRAAAPVLATLADL
jgi:DNA-binding MarR family transcriptional regulator